MATPQHWALARLAASTEQTSANTKIDLDNDFVIMVTHVLRIWRSNPIFCLPSPVQEINDLHVGTTKLVEIACWASFAVWKSVTGSQSTRDC